MYIDEILQEEFNFAALENHYQFEVEQNDDFALITVSPGNSFMYYLGFDLMSTDHNGERYDMPRPKLVGDFIRYCVMLGML